MRETKICAPGVQARAPGLQGRAQTQKVQGRKSRGEIRLQRTGQKKKTKCKRKNPSRVFSAKKPGKVTSEEKFPILFLVSEFLKKFPDR